MWKSGPRLWHFTVLRLCYVGPYGISQTTWQDKNDGRTITSLAPSIASMAPSIAPLTRILASLTRTRRHVAGQMNTINIDTKFKLAITLEGSMLEQNKL